MNIKKQEEQKAVNNKKKSSKTKKSSTPILTKLKLQTAKLGTNISLAILSKPNKVYKTTFELDIPYALTPNSTNPINNLQKMDIHIPLDPPKKLPVIFFMHGGAWSSGDKAYYSEFCQKLCEEQFIVVNINYRLIPNYSLSDIVKDCKKAINYALKNHKKYRIDKNNIFMIGDSAGAHLCSLLAGEYTVKGTKFLNNIRALGLYYGAYDLSTFKLSPFGILRTLDEYFVSTIKSNKINTFYQKYSPSTFITSNFPPSLLIAGKIDKLYNQSTQFANLLKQNNVEYQTLYFPKNKKDAIHGFLNFINSQSSQTAFNAVMEFFKSHIK